MRISTWGGQLTFRQWGRPYCMGVEDPFDCTDNCSRTFVPRLSSKAAKRFADAAVVLQKLDQPQGALRLWHLLALLWVSRLVPVGCTIEFHTALSASVELWEQTHVDTSDML